MSYAVYRLIDPRTQSTFYVGVTDNLAARYIQHLRCSDKNTRKNERIQEIKDAHFLPIPDTLEIIEERTLALKRERYWIQHYRYLGDNLLNAVFPASEIKHVEEEEVSVKPAMVVKEEISVKPISERKYATKYETEPVAVEELVKRRKPLTIAQTAGVLSRTERQVRNLL